jgi:hypothetical protein
MSEELNAHYVKILEKAFPNTKTRDNYASRLRALVRNLKQPDIGKLLKEPQDTYTALQKAYPALTTRKNVITALLVILREDPAFSANEELRQQWKTFHENLGRHQDAKAKRSEPEDKQIEKYTSFEEIESMYQTLKKQQPHQTQRRSFQFVLLSVLLHLRPKRADLGAVQIFREKDPARSDINYLVLRYQGNSFLSMHVYKTSKYHSTVDEDIPEGLKRDIEESLKRWPREYLFTKEDKQPMSNNTYAAFVRSTFEDLFGKATGVSLLRHIYISEKLDLDNMTLEEQEEEARYMLHTSGLQRRYKWPKKVLCPRLCAAYLPPTRRTRKLTRAQAKDGTRQTRKVPKKMLASE